MKMQSKPYIHTIMDSITAGVFAEIRREMDTLERKQRYLVGVGGFPGSGKSCECRLIQMTHDAP